MVFGLTPPTPPPKKKREREKKSVIYVLVSMYSTYSKCINNFGKESTVQEKLSSTALSHLNIQ
jgi:hypothetical protein